MQELMQFPQNILGKGNIHSDSHTAYRHKIRIFGEITDAADYIEEINCLESMSEHDMCEITLNSGGGNADGALALIDAINNCEGMVHCHMVGTVASAATFIALSCHSWSIAPHTSWMAHSPSSGYLGKSQEQLSYTTHQSKWAEKFYKDIYAGFFTKKEIKKILMGYDYWLDTDEVSERFDRMIKKRNKQVQAMMGESNEE